jgi:hypothetical protein
MSTYAISGPRHRNEHGGLDIGAPIKQPCGFARIPSIRDAAN